MWLSNILYILQVAQASHHPPAEPSPLKVNEHEHEQTQITDGKNHCLR